MHAHPLYLALLLMLHASVALALTPAGTIVRGQAAAIVNGETYLSNEVSTLVQAVCGVSITPNGNLAAPAHRVTTLAGAPAYLPYVVSNTGNAAHAYPLGLQQDPTSDWNATGYAFYLDANRNGRIDVNEDPVTRLPLEAGRNAHVVLAVTTPTGATGEAFLSPTATCPTAGTASSNASVVRLDPPAALQVEKRSVPTLVEPGETVTFDLTVTNTGVGAAEGPIVLTDLLNTPELEDVTFRAGSAKSSMGTIEYFDGLTWSRGEPAAVKGVRVRSDDLAPRERIEVSFTATTSHDATPGFRSNVVTLAHAGETQHQEYVFEIAPTHEHAFGPDDNSRALPGGEGTSDDAQEIDFLTEGQPTCRTVTLLNAGSSEDRFHLAPVDLPAGVAMKFETMTGTPLPLPVSLRAGEETSFRFCLTPAAGGTGTFVFLLRATSLNDGTHNEMRVRVGRVIGLASVTARLTATPSDALAPGQTVTYELEVINTSDADLTRVRLVLPFPTFRGEGAPVLEFENASHGGRLAPTGSVIWTAEVLPAGGRLARTVTFRVEEAELDGSIHRLEEAFTFRSLEITNPVESNTISHIYPGYRLLADLTISPKDVRIAQEAEIVFTLTNPTRYAVTTDLRNLLPTGLTLTPDRAHAQIGSARTMLRAAEDAEGLAWAPDDGSSLVLGPTGTPTDQLVLTYDVVANAQATPMLQVEGWATGTLTVGGTTTPIDSNRASDEVRVVEDAFTRPEGLLTGRVYLDRNGDRQYQQDSDVPLANARIVLSNGWQAATDSNGLYAFRDLLNGSWLVLLDPSSAPFPAPLGLRHHVNVQGIHVLDFPLVAPAGGASVTRSTTLTYGPVTLHKSLARREEATLVTLTLTTTEPLEDVTIHDPRPDGGTKELHLDVLDGKHVFTYEVPAGVHLTDPNVRWKDPSP